MNTNARITEMQAAVSEAATDAANRGIDQTVVNLKSGMTQAASGLENAQAQVKQGVEKVIRTTEELVQYNRGNLEAFVKSGQIWAAGVQDLSRQAAASAQASFEETVSTFKALATIRSVKQAIDLQADLARNSVDKAVADSSRFADASVKLAEQALAPLTARVKLAVEKFAKPV
jgi:phasin family protein